MPDILEHTGDQERERNKRNLAVFAKISQLKAYERMTNRHTQIDRKRKREIKEENVESKE